MAHLVKNSIIFTGRIGDITIYERCGKTVLRPRHNETPRHPRQSRAQRVYSLRIPNLVNFWNLFSPKEQPRFQDHREWVSDYNLFVSHAMQSSPIYLTRLQAKSGGCVATNVALSAGTLPPVDVENDGTAPATDISVGSLGILTSTTVGELARAILENNVNFQPDDIILHYLCTQYWDNCISTPRVRIFSHPLVLNPYSERPLSLEVGECVGFAERNGRLAASQNPEGGMAWVHLRHTPDKTLLSSQRLFCNNPYIDRFGSPEALEAATESYNKKR